MDEKLRAWDKDCKRWLADAEAENAALNPGIYVWVVWV